MKKSLLFIAIFIIALFPNFVSAKENNIINKELIGTNTKYYKTVTRLNVLDLHSALDEEEPISYSVEVSKEEYDAVTEESVNNRGTTVETTYKAMTTNIYQSGSMYIYQVLLDWKIRPSVRSYDIIGIGYSGSVTIWGHSAFAQYYCYSGGSCSSTGVNYSQDFTYGSGAAFNLVNGDLSYLSMQFDFYIQKNTTATIISLSAYGDYSHAITNVTSNQANNYYVNTGGINLDSSISSYYDSIQTAVETISVYW